MTELSLATARSYDDPLDDQASFPLETGECEASDLIVDYLESIGIEYAFGIPGGAVEPLYNAFARSERRGGLRSIVARHENGAAFMADGYARATGKIGVCVTTSGPGATNIITGVACAYDNSVPMLVITGQPALPSFGRRSFQESGCTGINIVAMLRHCTGYNSLVSHSDQLETKLANALMRAYQLHKPAHLSIPVDVMRSAVRGGPRAYDLPSLMKRPSLVDDLSVRELCDEIRQARKIVFLIGGGCVEAAQQIMELVKLTGALFVTAPDGKGLINPRHRAYRGVFGFGGHRSADEVLLDQPDMLIAIGTSMGEWSSGAWSEAILNDRLIHIDSSEESLARTPMARLHVQGRILSICERLIDILRASGHQPLPPAGKAAATLLAPEILYEGLEASFSDATPIKPQRLMRELSIRCPEHTQFLAETGNSMTWALHFLEIKDRRGTKRREVHIGEKKRRSLPGWLRITMDFCPMGWALGAAVGVARGNPDRPVVCISGDGSYLMNGQEITVAASEKLCVLYIILNDAALGMVKHGQILTGAEQTAFQLPQVDYRLMAESMGIPGHVVHGPEDLDKIDFAAIFRRQGPTLLDVRIDGTEIPPMNVRIKTLAPS